MFTYHKLSAKTKTLLFRISVAVLFVMTVQLTTPHVQAKALSTSGDLDFAVSSALTFEQIAKEDPLVTAVTKYLEGKKSPLKDYVPQIIKEDRWQMAMAVIAVESSFCKFADSFNCGSVGVGPKHPQWKKFDNHGDGFVATARLLQKPFYSQKYDTCAKMINKYVVPGSLNWKRGCEKVYGEMMNLTKIHLENTVATTSTHNTLASK